MSTDYELKDARSETSASKVNKAKAHDWKPAKPRPDASLLMNELQRVRDAWLCCNFKATGFHALQCANIWAELREADKTAMANDFPNAPEAYGDWNGVAWVAYAVTWVPWWYKLDPNPTMPRMDGTCPKELLPAEYSF